MLGTDPTDINKINITKCTPQKVCEQFGATCSFCRQQVPHPWPDQSDWSSEDWDRDKVKAREQNPIIKFDIPWPKINNWILMIQTDGLDKKVLEVLTTLILPLEWGAVGTAPKDGQIKLDTVPKEEEEQVAPELRM